MKLAIVMTTYRRPDGKTFGYITKALQHIQNQTYQNFKIFLIGDKYEDESEFKYFATSFFDDEKLTAINLSYALERDLYPFESTELWCSGGINARNIGIDMALAEGYSYICHLDHDDYWENDHLQQINDVIEESDNAAFIYTCATHPYLGNLPTNTVLDGQVVPSKPIPANLIHSSVCVNYKLLDFRYRDMFVVAGKQLPSDMDMWERISNCISENNYNSFLIRKLTCLHPAESTYNR